MKIYAIFTVNTQNEYETYEFDSWYTTLTKAQEAGEQMGEYFPNNILIAEIEEGTKEQPHWWLGRRKKMKKWWEELT